MSKKTKKKRTKSGKKNSLKYIIYFLLIVIFSLSSFIIGILISQKNYEKEIKKTQNSLKILQQKIKELKKQKTPQIKCKKKETNTSEIKPPPVKKHEPEKTVKKEKTFHKPHKKKPKLVIIIDDVAFKHQVNMIQNIPYKITPSFFPPTPKHPDTPLYAKRFSHYMIHLPLEASEFHKPEPDTLSVYDPYYKILNRIYSLKKMFPKAKFINNHTGSTYTSDLQAMVKLFKALKEEKMGFVDSKTTMNSQAKNALKKCYIPMYSRNVFIDNIENEAYIKNQLKKAVFSAKKRGYAIAIGHPHTVTLKTLKNARNILKDVEVVYIDELK